MDKQQNAPDPLAGGSTGTRKHLLRQLADRSGSMKTGLVLMGLWGAVSVAGSLIPGGEAFFESALVAVLPLALALSTGLCMTRQLRRLCMDTTQGKTGGLAETVRRWSVFILHVSVLVLAVAGAWGGLNFKTLPLTARTGEALELEDGTVITLAEPESPGPGQLGVLVVLVPPAGLKQGPERQFARPNHPATWGTIWDQNRLVLAGLQHRYRLVAAMPGQETLEFTLAEGEAAVLDPQGRTGFSARPGGGSGTLLIEYFDGPGSMQERRLLAGGSAGFDGTGLQVRLAGIEQTAGFIWRKTPGMMLVWTGLGLASLGSLGMLILPKGKPGV